MADRDVPAAAPRTSWLPVNLLLVVLALALAAAAVLWFGDGAGATPGEDRTASLSREYDEVTKAATDQALAFLTVDYRDMDPLLAKVLAGSTGSFKSQYTRSMAHLEASARASRVVSSGTVLSVGLSSMDARHAVVLVAADSQVHNKSSKRKVQPYRLKLSMTHQGDRWLTSGLELVG